MSQPQALPLVVHNAEAKRFEVMIEGRTGFSKYLRAGNKLVIEHTEVPVELEGRGIAGHIVRNALDFAREQKLVVQPLCPFAKAWLGRHPEYQDLLEN
jgi:predicted GNAT family acetyltransferase